MLYKPNTSTPSTYILGWTRAFSTSALAASRPTFHQEVCHGVWRWPRRRLQRALPAGSAITSCAQRTTKEKSRIPCVPNWLVGRCWWQPRMSWLWRGLAILQNLGKVDRTADDIFDEHLQNFTKQQNAANRLQKEFNNYIRCIRNVQTASKTLMDAVTDIYESQWSGHDLLYMQTQSIEMLWQDFSHKLADQVLIPLNTYQGQFPEMRKKIDKRGRKLVDYDSQRHSFQALQSNMSKKRDDVKVMRGREQLEEAKRTYEVLNSELHDELPALYDSRVLFLVTNLQTLFSSEQVFHSETSKVFAELEAIVDKLATESQRGSYTIKKNNGTLTPKSPNSNSTLVINNGPSSPTNSVALVAAPSEESPITPTKSDKPLEKRSPSPSPVSTPVTPSPDTPPESRAAILPTSDPTPTTVPIPTPPPVVNGNSSPTQPGSPKTPNANANNNNISTTNATATALTTETTETSTVVAKNVEELYDIPVGATTDNLPPGVLYRVKATYKYTREDVDELSFEVGDSIRVVEYDDPEEQEEGWLMGIKETTGEKGMFPANFTRPL